MFHLNGCSGFEFFKVEYFEYYNNTTNRYKDKLIIYWRLELSIGKIELFTCGKDYKTKIFCKRKERIFIRRVLQIGPINLSFKKKTVKIIVKKTPIDFSDFDCFTKESGQEESRQEESKKWNLFIN